MKLPEQHKTHFTCLEETIYIYIYVPKTGPASNIKIVASPTDYTDASAFASPTTLSIALHCILIYLS